MREPCRRAHRDGQGPGAPENGQQNALIQAPQERLGQSEGEESKTKNLSPNWSESRLLQ